MMGEKLPDDAPLKGEMMLVEGGTMEAGRVGVIGLMIKLAGLRFEVVYLSVEEFGGVGDRLLDLGVEVGF